MRVYYIETPEQFSEARDTILGHRRICIDVETTGLERGSTLRLVQIGTEDQIFIFPVEAGVDPAPILDNFFGTVIAHNILHERKYLPSIRKNDFICTFMQARLVEPTQKSALEECASRYFGDITSKEDLVDRGKELKLRSLAEIYAKIPLNDPVYLKYAANDVLYSWQLAKIYNKKIISLGLEDTLQLEKDLIPVVERMQDRGIAVDTSLAQERYDFHRSEEVRIDSELKNLGLETYGSGSVVSFLRPYLSQEQQNSMVTPAGNPSATVALLKELENEYADMILLYRKHQKVASTFYEPLIEADKGVIYSDFLPQGARTGRFSSRNPNLQNVPSGKGGPRDCYRSREGKKLISADYSQMEPRMLAYVTGDIKLQEAFNGEDFYASLDLPVSRSIKKVFFLAWSYGAGTQRLSTITNLGASEISELSATAKKNYPQVARFMQLAKDKVMDRRPSTHPESEGYVKTLMGRRVYFNKKNVFTGAVNGVIQGSAGEILKKSLIKADKAGLEILSCIHDEVLIEAPDEDAVEAALELESAMLDESVLPLLEADALIGERYSDFKDSIYDIKVR